MEHHSNIVPWQILCEEKGAKLRVVPIDDSGELLLDEFEAMLGPRTKLVSITHVSNALGTIVPVERIVELPMHTVYPCCWTALRQFPTCMWTSEVWTATFTCSPDTSCLVPPVSGSSTASAELLESMSPTKGAGK